MDALILVAAVWGRSSSVEQRREVHPLYLTHILKTAVHQYLITLSVDWRSHRDTFGLQSSLLAAVRAVPVKQWKDLTLNRLTAPSPRDRADEAVAVLVGEAIPAVRQSLGVGVVRVHLLPEWVSMALCQAAQRLYFFSP